MIRIIDRAQAVQEIADHLADRTAYVATIPPTLLDAIGSRLHQLPSWVAYIDNGTPIVLRTETGMDALLAMAQALADAAGAAFTAVITIPKTVTPPQIRAALGAHVPVDGNRRRSRGRHRDPAAAVHRRGQRRGFPPPSRRSSQPTPPPP